MFGWIWRDEIRPCVLGILKSPMKWESRSLTTERNVEIEVFVFRLNQGGDWDTVNWSKNLDIYLRERSELPLRLETSKNMETWHFLGIPGWRRSSFITFFESAHARIPAYCYKKTLSGYGRWYVPFINLPLFGVLCVNGSRCFPGAADTTHQMAKAGPTGAVPTHRAIGMSGELLPLGWVFVSRCNATVVVTRTRSIPWKSSNKTLCDQKNSFEINTQHSNGHQAPTLKSPGGAEVAATGCRFSFVRGSKPRP